MDQTALPLALHSTCDCLPDHLQIFDEMSLFRELFFTSLTEDGNLLASSRMFLGLSGFLNPALGVFFFSACFLIKQSSSFTVCVYCFFSARLNVNFTRLWSLFVCTRCIGWYYRCPMYSCWVEMLFDTVSTHFGILVILFYFLAYLGFCVTNATCIMSEQYHTISTMQILTPVLRFNRRSPC